MAHTSVLESNINLTFSSSISNLKRVTEPSIDHNLKFLFFQNGWHHTKPEDTEFKAYCANEGEQTMLPRYIYRDN